MKKLFFRLTLLFLPVGLMVALSNYLVDPANLFSSGNYVSGIANILSKGHNVDNISNYNERLLQEQMILKLDTTPDIIILGSSRIMEIGGDFFPGKKVLNCGVSHGNIYDIVALTGLLDSTGHLPSEIYLNADPELLSKKRTTEWQSLYAYYDSFVRKYGNAAGVREEKSNQWYDNLRPLFSLEYFRESTDFYMQGVSKTYLDVGKNTPQKYGRFSDGSICYSYEYTHPDSEQIAMMSLATSKKADIPERDIEAVKLMDALLRFYSSHAVKLHIVLLPYHPAYYEGIDKRQPGFFEEYERFYSKTATEMKMDWKGSFNPAANNIQESSFYDMYHCNKQAIKKALFNQ